jgi:hypothetical protein
MNITIQVSGNEGLIFISNGTTGLTKSFMRLKMNAEYSQPLFECTTMLRKLLL